MFGLIGKMRAQPGKREELISAIGASTDAMPGCKGYVIAEDLADPDSIWITELWDDEASHKASLQLPEVKAAIAKARPLIAGFDMHVTTRPVAGLTSRPAS